MDPKTFQAYRDLVYERSGINLVPGKESLVSARIGKRLRELGIADHDSYLQRVLDDATGQEITALLDLISTNVTSFYRESDHFELLEQAVSDRLRTGQTRLRVWSAACSSGEEPYCIAITLLETLRKRNLRGIDAQVLATDLSTRVLEAGRRGRYEPQKVEPVPKGVRQRYFARCRVGDHEGYEVVDGLKRMVAFRRLNLSQPPFPMRGPFDVVFCRNVMIYFDNQVRARLLREMERLLAPGGLLMVGHSESLTGHLCNLQAVRPSVYCKPERGPLSE
jgi:chemotaxis protein methyltransferase CheR